MTSKGKGKRRGEDRDFQEQHVQFSNPNVKRAHFSTTGDSGTHSQTRILARLPTLPISSTPPPISVVPEALVDSSNLIADSTNTRKSTQNSEFLQDYEEKFEHLGGAPAGGRSRHTSGYTVRMLHRAKRHQFFALHNAMTA
ncbi:hypothetical protein MVEN_00015700 [Mycena venus]|uniref:Uncharacterized protein n=1 Tax=Mycena venus TaxID=2733690 RepID=A0A8H6Z3G3_9AGAR|nr:hypothetical protein MVEN_00015700 [Mycena venus]